MPKRKNTLFASFWFLSAVTFHCLKYSLMLRRVKVEKNVVIAAKLNRPFYAVVRWGKRGNNGAELPVAFRIRPFVNGQRKKIWLDSTRGKYQPGFLIYKIC